VVMNGSGTLRFKADGSVSSVFNNNGLFDAQVDGLLDYSSGAGTAFNNNGIFRKSAGSGTTTVDVLFNNSGTVEANSGTIHFTRGFNQNGGALSVNGGDLTFAQALNVFSGTLGGSGTINGSVVNDAIVAPGFSPGQLSIVGTYAQTGAGQLNMEIGGTTAGAGFDRLDISGQATLSGTLNISLINSFSPASGSSFTIMTFASLSGDFANVTGLNLGDGRSFQLIYDATSLSLFVPTNSPPVAVDDTAVTNEDTPITIEVLANDMDGDGDTLIISSLTQPGSGSAVLNPDGTITYTPDPDYNVLDGSDNFSYTINDGNGEEDTAVVTLTVNPVNDAPVAEDDAASTPEDTAVTLAVLANDSDVDGDALTIDAVTQPGSGSAILNPNDTITYTPAASSNGSDSFSYTVSDGNGGSDTAVVSIQVAPENDNPTALNDTASTPEDTAVTIDVLANDSDIDGDTLTVTAVTTAANGTVQLNGDNSITFTPDANYNGADSFSYSVSDGSGGSASAGVTVAVNPVNDAPTAGDDSATTAEDTAVTLNALLNDTDVDGDTLTITAVTIPAHGAIAVNPDNSLTYTPEANYNGADSFSYSVSDPQGAMDTAQVTISITAVNDTPVANSDSTVTPEDTPVTVVVLANDTDVDGDALTVTAVTTATNGTVILNSDSSITYEPAASFNGLDGFSYTVNDGNGGSDSANVTITVTAENDNPTAADDSATTPEDTAVTLSILANDSDIDGDALVIDSVSQPVNGVAVINADNTVTYTPNANFNGANSFNYTVSDGQGGSDTAVVSISVIPVNDAPVALDDSGTTSAGTAVMLDVLLNDSDIDGDVLSVASVVQPGSGTAVAHTDGTITYTPDAGFSGTDSFNYTVSDGQGGSDSALVTVNVTPVAAACDLYPIALHEDSLAGAAPGDLIADIFNGSGAGSFGWLTWTGDNSVNALVASLTPPGNSHTFINPHAPDDHTVSISDWVEGKPGLSNAKSVRDALDALPSVEIVVPVWDSSDGSGSNTLYHVSGFARVRLLDYQLAGEDAISMEFLGTVSCSE
jgi:hypothetical protein